MADNEVSYLNLPEGIDPMKFLFGGLKLSVPESSLTPDLIAHLYANVLQMIEVSSLQSKNDENNGWGLESLRGMLQHSAIYGANSYWMEITAEAEVITSALPAKTPNTLLYLPLFPFKFPNWKEMPERETTASWGKATVCADIAREALLFGKNDRLYFASAKWRPQGEYFRWLDGRYPDRDDLPIKYTLCELIVEQVDWNDERILARIASGQWSDIHAFIARMRLYLYATANVLESRTKHMRRTADKLEKLPIYYGR